MNVFKKAKRISLYLSLLLMIVFALLANLNPARAEGIEPDQLFGVIDFALLLDGQSASFDTSTLSNFGFHTVGVISIGNPTLTGTVSKLKGPTGVTSGVVAVFVVGTGGRNWAVFDFGPIPNDGITATVDIDEGPSFGIVTSTVLRWSPDNPSSPFKWNVKVEQ